MISIKKVAFILLLSVIALPVVHANYVYCTKDISGSYFYIDDNTIFVNKSSTMMTVNTKIVSPDRSYIIASIEFSFENPNDCFRMIGMSAYDKDNNLKASDNVPSKFEPFLKGSIVESVAYKCLDILKQRQAAQP